MELTLLVALDRIDQLAGKAAIGLLAVDPELHHHRRQTHDKGGWNYQPEGLYPIRKRLVCVKEILPEVVGFHRL